MTTRSIVLNSRGKEAGEANGVFHTGKFFHHHGIHVLFFRGFAQLQARHGPEGRTGGGISEGQHTVQGHWKRIVRKSFPTEIFSRRTVRKQRSGKRYRL